MGRLTPFTLASLLFTSAAKADLSTEFWAGLSYVSYTVNHTECKGYDQAKAAESLSRVELCADRSLNQQVADLAKISTALQTSSEDRYFAALGRQQSLELGCAAGLADSIAADSNRLGDIENKLSLLRTARQELNKNVAFLSSYQGACPLICPSSLEQLTRRPPSRWEDPVKQPNYDLCYEACSTIIQTRQAVELITNSIPLSQVPTIRKFIENYSANPVVPQHYNFHQLVSGVYRSGAAEMRREGTRLVEVADSTGGHGYDDDTKHALIGDPSVVGKILKLAGRTPEIDSGMPPEEAAKIQARWEEAYSEFEGKLLDLMDAQAQDAALHAVTCERRKSKFPSR